MSGINIHEVSLDEVRRAYLKYKSYIYYDGNELFQRKKLAEYEIQNLFPGYYHYSDNVLNEKLQGLTEKINNYHEGINIEEEFGEIGMNFLPKKYKHESDNDKNKNFISNRRVSNKYKLEKVIIMADLSVEWHLIPTKKI